MCFVDDSTGAKEQDILCNCVENYLQQCTCKTCRAKQHQTEYNVGNVGNCRVSQSSLQQFFFISQHGTHENCDHRQDQNCCLCPCTTQEICTKQIVCHTDNGNYTTLCDDTGKDCGCRRRCNGVCCGQPCMQREHTCFTAKAQDHQEEYDQHHIFLAFDQCHIQCTTGNEGSCVTVGIQEEET